jgi:magnesium transporter
MGARRGGYSAEDKPTAAARLRDVGRMDVRLVTKSGVEERGVEELPLLLQGEDGLVWVDIPAWDGEAVRVLSEVFRFHPLAVNDAMERNRVPKMHAYRDHVFVILHAPERGTHGHVHYIELDQFIGLRYLVTVHGPINPAVHPDVALRETRAVLQRIQAGRLRPATASQLSHAIVTVLTREQEDFIETMTKDVWQLEQRLTVETSAIPRSTSTSSSVPAMASLPCALWAPKVARSTTA